MLRCDLVRHISDRLFGSIEYDPTSSLLVCGTFQLRSTEEVDPTLKGISSAYPHFQAECTPEGETNQSWLSNVAKPEKLSWTAISRFILDLILPGLWDARS